MYLCITTATVFFPFIRCIAMRWIFGHVKYIMTSFVSTRLSCDVETCRYHVRVPSTSVSTWGVLPGKAPQAGKGMTNKE